MMMDWRRRQRRRQRSSRWRLSYFVLMSFVKSQTCSTMGSVIIISHFGVFALCVLNLMIVIQYMSMFASPKVCNEWS
jgi:uncharacterized membrane protein YoaK (UPF0700 family)